MPGLAPTPPNGSMVYTLYHRAVAGGRQGFAKHREVGKGYSPCKIFGLAVRRRRQEMALTQEDLADRQASTYISIVELEKRNPALLNICHLAEALQQMTPLNLLKSVRPPRSSPPQVRHGESAQRDAQDERQARQLRDPAFQARDVGSPWRSAAAGIGKCSQQSLARELRDYGRAGGKVSPLRLNSPLAGRLKIPPSFEEVWHGDHREIGEAVAGAWRRWGGRTDQSEYLGRSARALGAWHVEEGNCARVGRGPSRQSASGASRRGWRRSVRLGAVSWTATRASYGRGLRRWVSTPWCFTASLRLKAMRAPMRRWRTTCLRGGSRGLARSRRVFASRRAPASKRKWIGARTWVYLGEERIRVHVFTMVLGYSRRLLPGRT